MKSGLRLCLSLAALLVVGENAWADMVGAHMYNYATMRNILATNDVAGVVPQVNWNNLDRFGGDNLKNSLGEATTVAFAFVSSGENNQNPDGQMVHDENGTVGSNNEKIAADTPYCTSQPTLWWINNLLTINGGVNDIWFYSRQESVQYSSDNINWSNFTWSAFENISVAHVSGWKHNEMYLRLPGNGPAFTAVQIVRAPPEINNDLGVHIFNNDMLAELRGTLTSGDANVWVYWGSTNGITNKVAWATNYPFGVNTLPAPVGYTNVIGPLGLHADYWYRYYASNDAGEVWATNSVYFKSEGGTAILVR